MSLNTYASRCVDVAESLKELLSGDEYEDVYSEIGKFSSSEWYQWREAHTGEVARFVALTPKQQDKFLSKLGETKKLRLVFAATQYCLEASEFLFAVDRHCQTGIPYRKMIFAAHNALEDVSKKEASFWPWGESVKWPGYSDWPSYEDFLHRQADE